MKLLFVVSTIFFALAVTAVLAQQSDPNFTAKCVWCKIGFQALECILANNQSEAALQQVVKNFCSTMNPPFDSTVITVN